MSYGGDLADAGRTDAGQAEGWGKASRLVGTGGRTLPAGRGRLLRRRPPARRAGPPLVPARLARGRGGPARRPLLRAGRHVRGPPRGTRAEGDQRPRELTAGPQPQPWPRKVRRAGSTRSAPVTSPTRPGRTRFTYSHTTRPGFSRVTSSARPSSPALTSTSPFGSACCEPRSLV